MTLPTKKEIQECKQVARICMCIFSFVMGIGIGLNRVELFFIAGLLFCGAFHFYLRFKTELDFWKGE